MSGKNDNTNRLIVEHVGGMKQAENYNPWSSPVKYAKVWYCPSGLQRVKGTPSVDHVYGANFWFHLYSPNATHAQRYSRIKLPTAQMIFGDSAAGLGSITAKTDPLAPPYTKYWSIDQAASWHNGNGGHLMADGHAEHLRGRTIWYHATISNSKPFDSSGLKTVLMPGWK